VAKIKIKEIFISIIVILLAVFGLFLAFQIIKKIFIGSWETEDLILAILFFNTGAVFSIIFILATIKSDLKHLSKKFDSLVSDFKGHLKEHN